MRVAAFLVSALVSTCAHAQEYKPYPRARITEAQWRAYFQEVNEKNATLRQEVNEHKFTLFNKPGDKEIFAFTQSGHPAHPAWVTRRLFEANGAWNVEQIGYFAGDEAAFAKLFADFKALNERMRESIGRERRPKAP